MSFGGFGGFGQSNNNNQSSGGFGFGANTNNTSTPGGFGSTNTTSAFGANKSTFGTPASGGGLFGSSNNNNNTTTSGNTFGAFGGNNNTTTTSGFGSSSGNGLFGANKPATTGTGFGSTSAGGGLFGGGGNNTPSGFGAVNNPGIGNAGDPPGTNTIPFQAYQEKEGGSSTTTNSFQNILFQDAYKKWSADELRLVDYAQGRRFGNASGGGAFGVNAFGSGTSAFGTSNNTNQTQTSAFGSSISGGGGGLFGANNNTTTTNSTGFGTNNNNTTSAFGSGGGMFGAKPAGTGGLFGGASTTNTPSGGLFGNSNAASSGTTSNAFGSNTGGAFGQTNTPAAGGGLFGNNAAKPATNAFGSAFGSNNTTGTTTGAFGQSNTATPGAFGQTNTGTTGGGLFGGGATPAANTGGGLFGNNNTTAAASTNAFGATNTISSTGGGLFGNNNAAKPGGLFGAAQTTTPATGGGLFGNNAANNATTTTNAFGAANNANSGTTGGGLFGAAKPATSGGLFGNNAPAATAGGGVFGNAGAANTTIQATGGLFGAAGQTQQKPSLFGQTQTAGTGAFGMQNSQAGGSLFGGAQAGSSLLGQSNLTGNQNVGTGAQGLNASINDVSAYGNASLFAGLSSGEVSNPGPLATPLSTKGKAKKSNVLPMYKLNPASSSRYATPQKRGFGFSYSTYGTPSSPASISGTPSGLGRSLLATSLSRGLSRSLSTNSLRRTYGGEEGSSGTNNGLATNSILTPGAFSSSTTSRYYGGSGSLNSGNKKLIINRDVRSDLFSTPSKEKPLIESSSNPAPVASGSTRKLSKRVSFETNGGVNSDKEEVSSAPKSRVSALANSERGIKASVSMPSLHDSVKGNELAIVHEEEIGSPVPTPSTGKDSLPGQYWMSPSIKELSSMNRLQRQSVVDFTVGRENVGQVQFKVPVDLSNIDIDDIVDNIVILETRSATVYPIAEKKPPMGRGLNVPARITLEQSWPRGKRDTSDETRIAKHVNRLRRIVDTEFEEYDSESGVWVFSVEHFTTYGLDDEDESDADATEFPESTETALAAPQNQVDLDGECSILSPSSDSFGSDPDDTFDFRNKRLALPGTFDSVAATNTQPRVESHLQSFLGVSSVGSGPNQIMLSVEDSDLGDEYAASEGEDMASLTTGKHHAAEHFEDYSSASSEVMEEDMNNDESEDDDLGDDEEAPGGGVLRARMRALKMSAGPVRVEVTDGNDWMDMLKKTVSPVKRDRVQFRDGNAELMPMNLAAQPGIVDSEEEERELLGIIGEGRGFATTIDLMNSLFERPSSKPKPQPQPRGFVQWPYDRQPKVANAPTNIPTTTRVRWGTDGTMVMATRPAQKSLQPMNLNDNSILSIQNRRLPDELSGVRLGRLSADRAAHLLDNHMRHTKVNILNGVPKASLDIPSLKTMFQDRNTSDTGAAHEKLVWDLASILFDPIQDGSSRDRKDKLSAFWTDLVASSCATEAAFSKSLEMKAVASLAGHRVQEACKHLLDGKNFHLATLVSLIGTDETLKNDMRDQLSGWRDAMMLSELSEPIRAIYEMIAGNVCVCEGIKGVPPQDRIDSFIISTKFSLDWMQAFGLRLWYATSPNDSLAVAIRKFHDDISQGLEPLPMPWFIKQAIAPLWDDKARDQRQDLLWGLLKLYAGIDIGLECVICPENSQMSPLDWRLSWQLGQALSSVTDLSFGANSETQADSATLSFASQLINEGSWLQAVFVLLHIHDPDSRAKAIRDQLAQNAGSIGIESDDTFITLTQVFKIPAAWVWESQALYMRSVMHDAPAEVHCLLRAGALVEAHQRFTEEVAPLAIIERDYKLLSSILTEFEDRHDAIPNWSLGGDVYQDFLSIITIKTKKESVPISLLTKMLSTLPAMQEASVNQDALVTAAVSEMSSILARIITEVSQDSLLHRVLSIPLTEDGHLKYSIDLSIAYYKGIMTR
ncbi:Nucleoporin NUP145 [Ceratocystis lukuohia]|uniref:Nucleoporin NUP145 n=1 Tax=Ceratocystis lukuohia TaxID=2019550 RepID=A0ABR4MTU4_9PEZI